VSPLPNPAGLHELKDQTGSDNEFNGPLYGTKAFGFATFIVAISASVAVWSVKKGLGVKDVRLHVTFHMYKLTVLQTQEFADRMRHIILTKFPILSRRIHIHTHEDEGDSLLSLSDTDVNSDWKWSEAEKRLNDAMDEGGLDAWAHAAVIEMEHEANKTKRERRLDRNDKMRNP
jgi:hypothetical protein